MVLGPEPSIAQRRWTRASVPSSTRCSPARATSGRAAHTCTNRSPWLQERSSASLGNRGIAVSRDGQSSDKPRRLWDRPAPTATVTVRASAVAARSCGRWMRLVSNRSSRWSLSRWMAVRSSGRRGRHRGHPWLVVAAGRGVVGAVLGRLLDWGRMCFRAARRQSGAQGTAGHADQKSSASHDPTTAGSRAPLWGDRGPVRLGLGVEHLGAQVVSHPLFGGRILRGVPVGGLQTQPDQHPVVDHGDLAGRG